MTFFVILIAVFGLMQVYLWKRLVKDTSRSARTRSVLTIVLLALMTLLVATLTLPRVLGPAELGWLAWPGYFWFGLAAYLFLTLLVLEPVRFVLYCWARRRPRPTTEDPPTVPPVETERAETTALNRRLFLARTGAVAAGAASVSLVGVGAFNALGPPDVLQVPVRLRRLDTAFNGFRIAVVSDIHLGPLARRRRTSLPRHQRAAAGITAK